MKIIRFVGLVVALAPFSTIPSVLAAPPSATPSPAAANGGLPPGAPPLTSAQIQQQKAIKMKANQDYRSIVSNSHLSPQQKQQQVIALSKSVDAQMLALLTPAQRAAVEAQRNKVIGLQQSFVQQHQQEIKQRQQLAQALSKSISSEQRAKMKAIQDAANQQLKSLETNTKMTPQAKVATAGAIERDAARDAIAVLSSTQQTQFKQFQALNEKLQTELMAFAKAHHTQ